MGLLTGGAAALFGEIMTPLYCAARMRSLANTYSDTGRLRRGGTWHTCRAQVDRATERMVGTEGYTASDRAIYILDAGLTAPVDTDCEIELLEGPYAGALYKVASPVDRDPAAAYWLCRGVEKKAAPGG